MLGTHFYHRIIRKCVVAFGTLFNNITLVRYNKDGTTSHERFKVPLNYAPKEKFIYKILQDPNLVKSVAVSVPRMSFEIAGFDYDSSRKQQSTISNFATATATNKVKQQYLPIPYNIDFSLSIYVRNHEDGTQIVEQILPYFTPDYTMSVNLMSEMGRKYDFPVILNDVSQQIDYEGNELGTRLITWTLNFTSKAWIFGPVKTSNIILGVAKDPLGNTYGEPGNTYSGGATTHIYNDINRAPTQKLYLSTNGANVANVRFVQSEVVRARANNLYGYVEWFDANNRILYVSQSNGVFEPGMFLTGDYSNARWNVSAQSVNVANTIMATVSTRQDPITAVLGDSFGFEDTITEYE
jgi:hypothetical protein